MEKINMISVEGLSEEDIRIVEELVNLLKDKPKKRYKKKQRSDKVVFLAKKSDVIGPLTREEIYDYL
jgi:hypothetical protein